MSLKTNEIYFDINWYMFFRRAAILKCQIEYLRLEGPTLLTLNSTIKIPSPVNFQASCQYPSLSEQNPSRSDKLYIANDSNGNIRALYLALLNICYDSGENAQNENVLLNFKELVYGCSIPIERYTGLLQRYGLLVLARVNVLKKLVAEFLQLLSLNQSESVSEMVKRYPIIDIVLLVIIRVLLSNNHQKATVSDLSVKMDTKELMRNFSGVFLLEQEEVYANVYRIGGMIIRECGEYLSIENSNRIDANKKGIPKPTDVLKECFIHHVPSKTELPIQRKLSIQQNARVVISEESQSFSNNDSDVIERYKFIHDSSNIEKTNEVQLENSAKQESDMINSKFAKIKLTESAVCPKQELNSLNSTMVEPAKQGYEVRETKWLRNFWSKFPDRTEKIQVVSPIAQNHVDKKKQISVSKERLFAKKKPNLDNLPAEFERTNSHSYSLSATAISSTPRNANIYSYGSSSNIRVQNISNPLVRFTFTSPTHQSPNLFTSPSIQGFRTQRHSVYRYSLS